VVTGDEPLGPVEAGRVEAFDVDQRGHRSSPSWRG
jgi:hypothetical protein